MVRRRSASPRASGPVRAPSSPMRAPARTATTPATIPKQAPMATQQRQPGLLGQMAATAGGVAIGSAVVLFLLVLNFGLHYL